jgi:hypothetical protein
MLVGQRKLVGIEMYNVDRLQHHGRSHSPTMTFRDNTNISRQAAEVTTSHSNVTIIPPPLRPVVLLSAAVSSEMMMTGRRTYLACRLDPALQNTSTSE